MSTHNIPFSIQKETFSKLSRLGKSINYPKSAAMVYFPRDLLSRPKNEFESAVVNEPSVFEPLKLLLALTHSFAPDCSN